MSRKSKLAAGILAVVCVGTILGFLAYLFCTKEADSKECPIYNGYCNDWIQDGNKFVSYRKGEEYALYEKETEREYNFLCNPFEEQKLLVIFPYESEFFYFGIEDTDYALFHYDDKFNQNKLFEERAAYSVQNQLLGEKEDGTMDLASNIAARDKVPVQFVVLDDEVFYLTYNGIWKRDLNGKKEEQLLSFSYLSPYISLAERQLFYVEEDYILRSYSIDERKVTEYSDIYTEQFALIESGIVFSNALKENELYFYDFEQGKIRDLKLGNAECFDVEGNQLYYFLDHKFFRMDIEENAPVPIGECDDSVSAIKKLSGTDTIAYLITNEENELEVCFFEIAQ